MTRAAQYSVGLDFGTDPNPDNLDFSPYWIIAIISQGTLLSYSRKTASSFFKNLSNDDVLNTTPPLIISDDCLNMSTNTNKRSPASNFQATLKQTDTNYLTKIFPGDYVFAWMVNNQEKYQDLLTRIKNIQPCNKFDDGLKFIGRVEDVRKRLSIEPGNGPKTVSYTLTATGFAELQTMFFYDYSLASNDAQEQSLGQWLARMGVDYQTLFGKNATTGIQENNINDIIPTLLNLIIGTGPSVNGNISVPGLQGNVSATPTLASEAPYAYVIPLTVGRLLGKNTVQPGKPTNVLSYSDILEMIMGLQVYSTKTGVGMFSPDIDEKTVNSNKKKTTKPMLGTFLPAMTEFTNVPVWNLLQKYLNPVINELYATLRVSKDGEILPTVICRQIPFTTEAFITESPVQAEGPSLPGQPPPYDTKPLNVTKFLDIPQWVIPNVMIQGVDIGRSDSMRKNFIHVYGSAALQQNNVGVNEQIVVNPPIRDDMSIQSHGLIPYMSTVECFVNSQVGLDPSNWMRLCSDWLIQGHLTLSGTLQSFLIQSPIAVGDNLVSDGVVFHIEAISHSVGIDSGGIKYGCTSLQLSNGMRADGVTDDPKLVSFNSPLIFAGMSINDQTSNDPGLSLEGPRTTGGLPIDKQPMPNIIFTPDQFKDPAVVDKELMELL